MRGLVVPVADDDVAGDQLDGRIVRFDRFGNAISNITASDLEQFLAGADSFAITVGDMCFTAVDRSYFEGAVTCLIGSSGYLEFGSFMKSLRELEGLGKGDEIRVRRWEGGESRTKGSI